jgi:hypothetical protein
MSLKQGYTKESLLYFLEENSDLKGYNGRKRYVLDQRNYIIHILFAKFGLTEKEIAKTLKIKRSAVHHSKYHAYYHQEYEDFQLHTERLKRLFPFNPVQPEIIKPKTFVHKCTIELTEEEFNKMNNFKKKHDEISIGKAIRKMIRLY